MNCHDPCGACCIAPYISSALPNMPNGKPAGVRCLNLNELNRCTAYTDRPDVCRDFMPDRDSCGHNETQALQLLTALELTTKS